jgi:CRP-like cAMP-binding protein
MDGGLNDKFDVSREREAWLLAHQSLKKPVFNRTEAEQSRILTLISTLRPLQGLPFEQRIAISKVIKFRVAVTDEVLLSLEHKQPIRPGVFEGQRFMIVTHGCVKHQFQSVNGRVTRELFRDDVIGMPTVTASIPADSKYTAVEPTELIYVEMDQYEDHLAFLDRLEVASRIDFFKNQLVVPILASWTDAEFEVLARSVYPLRYQSRTVSIREGEKADCVFFLTQGKMKVVREIDFSAACGEPCAKMLELATLNPGEYYGELAHLRIGVDDKRRQRRKDKDMVVSLDDLSDGESEFELKHLNPNVDPLPRQSTVYAHTPAEVLVLPRLKFIELFHGSALVRVMEYARGYPPQTEIRAHYQRQQRWSDFKDQVMAQVVTGAASETITPGGAQGSKSGTSSKGASLRSSRPLASPRGTASKTK